MTRRDFEAIAATVRAFLHDEARPDVRVAVEALVSDLMDNVLAPGNTNFDRQRFMAACID